MLLDLTSAEQRNFTALATALERRFGQQTLTQEMRNQQDETLGAYAADIRFYAQREYPSFDPAALEELALNAFFFKGLLPSGENISASWPLHPATLGWRKPRGSRLFCPHLDSLSPATAVENLDTVHENVLPRRHANSTFPTRETRAGWHCRENATHRINSSPQQLHCSNWQFGPCSWTLPSLFP